MPIFARRIYRLSLTTALALTIAYAFAFPLPFIAPLFAFMLTSQPSPPINPKGLIGLIALVAVTLGIGLMIIPLLVYYPMAAILIIAVGLYLCGFLLVNLGKELVGTFLAVGFTIIPLAGTIDISLAVAVIQSLILGISVAVICQWMIYPWLPEDGQPTKTKTNASNIVKSKWRAWRFALIVLPPFLLALTNPVIYLKLIMKSLMLGQQGSMVSARHAGRELLGSTLLGGGFAIIFWLLLKINPTLFMFSAWMLIFVLYFSSKLYGILKSSYPPSFWLNVFITMLILIGSAVQDSANGDDVYQAFIARMSMFTLLTLYSWAAIYVLELIYNKLHSRADQSLRITHAN